MRFRLLRALVALLCVGATLRGADLDLPPAGGGGAK
jgi:hypothetical protein